VPSLTDVLLKRVRDADQLDVKRADFKLDMVPPHLFMNFRVVDEHGRQLGMGRNLGGAEGRTRHAGAWRVPGAGGLKVGRRPQRPPKPMRPRARGRRAPRPAPALPAGERYTAWTFGELPELMEIRRGAPASSASRR
jgi:ATP-dependent helicase HrpA